MKNVAITGLFIFLATAAFLTIAPARLRGQAVGEIVGSVVDPTGAVIPNAKVTAVQRETGFPRSTVSSAAGTYTLAALPVGTYRVIAERQGFATASVEATLDVNQQREVNFTLAVGGTVTQVQVSAAPPLLTTTNDALGGLVNGQQVVTLPLNGRSLENLLLLQPGVQNEPNTQGYHNLVAPYVTGNGNRGPSGASFLDDAETTDDMNGGYLLTNFDLDALAEVKVLQNNYSAEYGHGAGYILLQVSKSGTNQLHGSAFEFLRNSAFDSRNFFSSQVPELKRNEFGGTIGGPITIPHLYDGKDRSFFFFQYAGYRQETGEPQVFPVPTLDERKGIVDIVGANGQPDQLLVPLNSVAQTIANRYPMPNDPSGPFGPRTFDGSINAPLNRDQWSGRVDHRFSEKDSLFGRFTTSHNFNSILEPDLAIEDPSFTGRLEDDPTNLGINYTHVFSPTLLNSLRFSGIRTNILNHPGTITTTSLTFADGSLDEWGPASFTSVLHPESYHLLDNVNWAKGRHSISTGFEFVRIRLDQHAASVGGFQGQYSFLPGIPLPVAIPSASGNNNLNVGDPSPTGLISFLIGDPSFYSRTIAFPGFGPSGGGFAPFGLRRFELAGYFQDDVSVSRKLTLTFGLRYEYNSVVHEVAGRLAGIVDDPHLLGGSVFQKLVLNPDPVYYPDHRGIGPRFGLAYKLDEKTVFRGGYGIFTNKPLGVWYNQGAVGFPFAAYGTTINPPFSLTPLSVAGLPVVTDLSGNALPPGGNTAKVPPNTPVNLVPIAQFFGGPVQTNIISMNWRNGYTMAGNVTLERELPGEVLMQVAYVTNNAAKLFAAEYPNAYTGALPQYTPYTLADPGLGEFQLNDNHAHSTYNSLQVMVRKASARHGIQFQSSYTWSKTLDNASTVFNGPGTNSSVVPQDPTCYRCEKGPSAFDFPQRWVVNFIYALPFDRWQALSHVPARLTGGWQITTIYQIQSGTPFTVNDPFGLLDFGIDTYYGTQSTRPDLLQRITNSTSGGPQLFSNAVVADGINLGQQFFGTPGCPTTSCTLQSRPGDLGRNTFRSPSYSNTDFSLVKDTKINERATLQFRAEFFNFFNQHAFGLPGAVLGSPGFGSASSTVLPERQIQFALKLIF